MNEPSILARNRWKLNRRGITILSVIDADNTPQNSLSAMTGGQRVFVGSLPQVVLIFMNNQASSENRVRAGETNAFCDELGIDDPGSTRGGAICILQLRGECDEVAKISYMRSLHVDVPVRLICRVEVIAQAISASELVASGVDVETMQPRLNTLHEHANLYRTLLPNLLKEGDAVEMSLIASQQADTFT